MSSKTADDSEKSNPGDSTPRRRVMIGQTSRASSVKAPLNGVASNTKSDADVKTPAETREARDHLDLYCSVPLTQKPALESFHDNVAILSRAFRAALFCTASTIKDNSARHSKTTDSKTAIRFMPERQRAPHEFISERSLDLVASGSTVVRCSRGKVKTSKQSLPQSHLSKLWIVGCLREAGDIETLTLPPRPTEDPADTEPKQGGR